MRVLVLLFMSAAAAAQTPPIKPGLWEMTPGPTLIDGKPMPDMREQLAKLQQLPPQARAQVEAQMKAQGVALAGGKIRSCVSAAMLQQGRFGQQQQQGRCQQTVTERSAATWRWKSVCEQPKGEGEGVARISSAEAYSVEMQWRGERQGRAYVMNNSASARWLGADCGDLKPLQ